MEEGHSGIINSFGPVLVVLHSALKHCPRFDRSKQEGHPRSSLLGEKRPSSKPQGWCYFSTGQSAHLPWFKTPSSISSSSLKSINASTWARHWGKTKHKTKVNRQDIFIVPLFMFRTSVAKYTRQETVSECTSSGTCHNATWTKQTIGQEWRKCNMPSNHYCMKTKARSIL